MQGLHLEEQMAVPPPLGLTMIVKNEADFIAQTLASTKDVIDHWTIVDTGERPCSFISSTISSPRQLSARVK